MGVRIGLPVSHAGVIEEHAGSHWRGLSLSLSSRQINMKNVYNMQMYAALFFLNLFIFQLAYNCFAMLCFRCTTE